MLDAFTYPFMQKALIAGFLVAISSSMLGVFLVLRRMSLLGDGLAHISFAGVALGFFFKINPFLSAFAFSALASLAIDRLKQLRIYGDTAIAILFSFGLALGAIIISSFTPTSIDLMGYLFGSVLSITWEDIILISLLAATVLLSIFLLYKELQFISFDEETAKASGIPVQTINTYFTLLTCMAVVLSLKTVGILLVSSLMVIPSVIGILLSKSFTSSLAVSAGCSVLSVVAGIFLSYLFGISAGGAIVLVLVFMFIVVLVVKRLKLFAKS